MNKTYPAAILADAAVKRAFSRPVKPQDTEKYYCEHCGEQVYEPTDCCPRKRHDLVL